MQHGAHNKSLDDALSDWPTWPVDNQPQVIKAFTDGLNHSVYVLQDGSRQLVLKLFKQPHKAAIEAQQWAADHHLAPSILYANDVNDYALMTLVPQPSIKPLGATPTQLSALAKGLQALHAADYSNIAATVGTFNLFGFCRHYLTQLKACTQRSPLCEHQATYQRIFATHTALTPILQILTQDDFTPALCHNDLVAANCFVTESGACFYRLGIRAAAQSMV